jgi:hypothetical protein
MAAEQSAPWQEIISPAPPPPETWQLWLWAGAVVVLLALAAWLWRRWWRQPRRAARRALVRIRHEIETGAITPRAGLYAVAACLPEDGANPSEREMLAQRFARHEPDHDQVIELLRGLQA